MIYHVGKYKVKWTKPGECRAEDACLVLTHPCAHEHILQAVKTRCKFNLPKIRMEYGQKTSKTKNGNVCGSYSVTFLNLTPIFDW